MAIHRAFPAEVVMRRMGLVLWAMLAPVAPAMASTLPALVYHDIVVGAPTDEYSVSVDSFREQMDWLRREGYQPVSLRQLEMFAAGTTSLPAKPVLLTFDDGLASFQTRVIPILEKLDFPAVLSVVTGWVDGREVPENYRGRLLTWEQLRSLQRHKGVEIISHTDNLHRGIRSNPQGNQAPAAITRRYDLITRQYESESEFRNRIRADLRRSVTRLKAELDVTPAAIAWPYGYYDGVSAEEATAQGLKWQLAIARNPASRDQLPVINRLMLYKQRTMLDFERLLQAQPHPPRRVLEIQLDDFSLQSNEALESWLSSLITRLELMRMEAVIINPFGPNGARNYFANDASPGSQDILNRILHQLRTRLDIRHLWLRLEDRPIDLRWYQELARRHPYDGILVAGTMNASRTQTLQRLFAYHRPGLECGQEGGAVPGRCADFRVQRLPPDQIGSCARDATRDAAPVYCLLENHSNVPGDTLIRELQALQDTSWPYLGFQYGAVLDDPGVLTQAALILLRATGAGR